MIFYKGVSDEDLYNFFYILSRYTGFGLKLNDAVSMYADKTDNESMKSLMKSMKKDLDGGTKFSDAIGKHTDVFPSFIVEMIRIGEVSSQMSSILESLTFHMEQEIRVNREVRSALLPQKIFLVLLTIAVILILFLVIPKMGELLKSTDLELPFFTKMVVAFGDFAASFWWLFLILAVAAFFMGKSYKENNPEEWDALMLKVPFFSELNYNRLQYRFAMIFGLCLQSGIDTRRALEYTSNAVDNLILKKTIQNAVRLMTQRGMTIQDALLRANEETKVLHQDFRLMLAVGSSGAMDEIMLSESKKYQDQMVRLSKGIGDKIGVAVAIPGYVIMLLLFMAIEFPIFTMIGNIGKIGGD